MNRYPGMHILRVALLASALIGAACGGEQSVASKSAAAYREAQAKGIPVGGGHEHGAPAATATTTPIDHSAHGTGADPHAGMNHGTGSPAAMDHSAHGAANAHAGHGTTANAHAGHRTTADAHAGHGRAANAHAQHRASPATGGAHGAHGTTPAATHDQHAGMQHGTQSPAADPHAGHRAAVPPGTSTIAAAPRSNTEMQRLRPAATLSGDAFDAPAPASVSEAAKAAQGGGHEGHQATTVYSCPMHPEVTSDQPGTCPKCGMALVPKK
jgi:hypothetical protein